MIRMRTFRAWAFAAAMMGAVSAAVAGPVSADEAARRARAVQLNRRMGQLIAEGRYAEALPLAESLAEMFPEHPTVRRNLAAVLARLERYDDAVAELRKAIDLGYTNLHSIRANPGFAPLKSREDFRALEARRDRVRKARALRIAEQLRTTRGEGWIVEIDHESKLIFAARLDREVLDAVKRRLNLQARTLWDDLFAYRFEEYITVVISDRPAHARKDVHGVYRLSERELSVDSVGWPLRHEFTHALHMADAAPRAQLDQALWVKEGLATLYEYSEVRGEGDAARVVPVDSDRLALLQRHLDPAGDLSLTPLATLLRLEQKNIMHSPGLFYAMSRYLMMYLYEQGKLGAFYRAYADGYRADPRGGAALAEALGKPLEDVEADWHKWLRARRPWRGEATDALRAFGVDVRGMPVGLEVVTVHDGSAARAAGLRAGDRIVRMDGRLVADVQDFQRIVNRSGLGGAVALRIRRDGTYRDVTVTLPESDAK